MIRIPALVFDRQSRRVFVAVVAVVHGHRGVPVAPSIRPATTSPFDVPIQTTSPPSTMWTADTTSPPVINTGAAT